MPALSITSSLDVDRDSRSADVDRVRVAVEVDVGEGRDRRMSIVAVLDDLTGDVVGDGELDVVLGGIDERQLP